MKNLTHPNSNIIVSDMATHGDFDQYTFKYLSSHLQILFFRYMATEAFDPTHVHCMKYYHYGSDVPFNFDLTFVKKDTDGLDIHRIVDAWLSNLPEGKWPNWVVRRLLNFFKEKLASFEIGHQKN